MKQTIFTGAATALITPMNATGIDYKAYGRLIEWQIAEGIDALVAAGTTGESATLSEKEHCELLEFTVKTANGRVPVIAGTGSNNTAHAIELSRHAEAIGADGLLLVTPYYNKATPEGLFHSFAAVAEAVTAPIILYNVPSRTGCNLTPETAERLAEYDNIVAVKEASGNLSQVAELAALTDGKLVIYSGNDDQILPVLSLGGKGVISVLSNLLPRETSKMCHDFLEGRTEEARKAQLGYLPLIHALFSEVNPIPAKAAMAAMGYGENLLRLPLTAMNREKEKDLLLCMRKVGLPV